MVMSPNNPVYVLFLFIYLFCVIFFLNLCLLQTELDKQCHVLGLFI